MGTSSPQVAGCLIVVVAGGWLLWINRRRLRGSTLLAPWIWSLLGLCSLAAVEIYGSRSSTAGSEMVGALRFAAAVTTLLPEMALLGAQRPHARIWQFVVASLWLILVLPVAQYWLWEAGSDFRVPATWAWFLWVLIALGLLNRMATRYWLVALLVAAGQCLVLAGQLPGIAQKLDVVGTLSAVICFTLAILIVHVQLRGGRPGPTSGFDRAWFDFRDMYGVFWALRLMDRINTLAERHQWELQLNWRGLSRVDRDSPEADADSERQAILHQNMRNLLRRFVATDWIESRLPAGDPLAPSEPAS